jgi:CheY-like chemotaxis protein
MLAALAGLLLLALAVALWQTVRWRRAQAAAHAAAQAKQNFLASMSHEIRTPMNGVLGIASLLEESGLNAGQRQYARTIRQSASALLRILNDVLDVAKMEAGKFRLSESPFDLRDLAGQVSALLEPEARRKGLEWRLDWEAGLPNWWTGDGARIRQVLLNLAGNAVKFTREGAVALSVSRAPEGVRLEVADTGPGIAPALRSQLFQNFVQGEPAPGMGPQGTGLGLAISRSLIERMNGSISLDSEPGRGARFTVLLPLREADPPAPAPAAPGAAGAPGGGRRVLVVEDNEVNQFVAKRMLARLGCAVEVAADGQQALERLAQERYDLVFMDCGLPGMDGYQVTRAIRAAEDGRARTPIIAMTAAALEGDREKCLYAGMDDYLPKPIELEALAQAVARWTAPAQESVRR